MDDELVKSSRLYGDLVNENRVLILQLKRLYAWIDSLKRRVDENEARIAEILADSMARETARDQENNERVAELERTLLLIRSSRSWRLTRPLRVIAQRFHSKRI